MRAGGAPNGFIMQHGTARHAGRIFRILEPRLGTTRGRHFFRVFGPRHGTAGGRHILFAIFGFWNADAGYI